MLGYSNTPKQQAPLALRFWSANTIAGLEKGNYKISLEILLLESKRYPKNDGSVSKFTVGSLKGFPLAKSGTT